MSLKHSVTATGTNNAGSQVSKVAWNADHAIDSDGLVIPAGAAPTAPASGSTRIFAKDQGGRVMPAFMGPSGLDSLLMPHLAKNGWSQWKPTYTGTSISAIGGPGLTATGTATSAPYATTSLHTRTQRVDYLVTTAATTAVAGFRVSAANWRPQEGFHWILKACPATGTADANRRCFIGLQASTGAPTDVNPSTLLNIIGVGYDSGDTNWQVMTNNGTGAAAKVDTGIAKPTTDRQTMYSIMIFSPPGGAWVGVRIVDEGTGATFDSGQLSADIPSATTGLTINSFCSAGGTSSVIGLTMAGIWVDTDN